MEKIGFIGLGIMGRPMCLNLLKSNFYLTVYNRTQSRVNPLVEAGANSARSPEETAKESDIIITMVSDTQDVQDVILGQHGVIHGVRPGCVVIDMSTISPSATKNIASELKAVQVEMLDAPVSGGDTGAVQGSLAIMVGGSKTAFTRCLPVFQAMGKSITYVGGNGAGQTTKLCNQILVTITNMAVCESVLFAIQSGLDPQLMIEAVQNGAAGSWQLSNLGPKMVKNDYKPGFMIDLQQKDLKLVLEAARETGIPLPAASLVHQLFHSCQIHDEGREGTQALFKSYKRLGLKK